MPTNTDTHTHATAITGLVQVETTTYLRTTCTEDVHVQPTYPTFIVDIFDSAVISYLPLNDPSGSTMQDASTNNRDGATGGATGPTLGVAGIDDGQLAISLPGSAAYVNWYSAGLAGAFDGEEGTLIVWAKVGAAGVWADGTYRVIANLYTDSNNFVTFARSTTTNLILVNHKAGGTDRNTYPAFNAYTGWMMIGLTWSVAAGTMYAYVNGARQGASLGAPGSWFGL